MKINHKEAKPFTLRRRIRLGFYGVAAVMFFYVFTIGLVPVVVRHTGDSGRLQWLPSVPGAMATLEIYELPARLPILGKFCEMSANLWWAVADPTDTTP